MIIFSLLTIFNQFYSKITFIKKKEYYQVTLINRLNCLIWYFSYTLEATISSLAEISFFALDCIKPTGSCPKNSYWHWNNSNIPFSNSFKYSLMFLVQFIAKFFDSIFADARLKYIDPKFLLSIFLKSLIASTDKSS